MFKSGSTKSYLAFALVVLSLLFVASGVRANDLRDFLTNCAYGTGIGAGVGVISMAISEQPEKKTQNIAKGASLGLYGGIGYGLYELNSQSSRSTTFTYIDAVNQKFFLGYNF